MARQTTDSKQAAIEIVRRLRQHGHVALLAGGCVRDMLLGRTPSDYDVATDAVPDRVVEYFRTTRKVGAQFGVVLVRMHRVWVEVATFRADHEYADGRHPTAVTFSSPTEDAKRRDFTINGMFYDPIEDRVIDYVDGQEDLRAGIIRTIGRPEQRFAEDHLRQIRAVRFAARLGYAIEPDTLAAIRTHAADLTTVSAERVREELARILGDSSRAAGFRLLRDTNLLAYVWPEAEWTPDRIRLSEELLARIPDRAGFPLSLACILIHWPSGHVDRICRALTCSNDVRKQVVWLVTNYTALTEQPDMSLADLKLLMQNRGFADLLTLCRAWLDVTGQDTSVYDRLVERSRRIPFDEIAPPPLLDGQDLIDMGQAPGPTFKRVLDAVYRAQLNREIVGRDEAIALAKTLLATS